MKEEISLGELIVILLKFLKKNILLFFLAGIIGAVIGYFKESRVVPKHKSEAVICSDILDASRLKDIVSDLESATKNRNLAYLAETLNIPADSAAKISSIKIELIESETNYRSDVDMTKIKTHQCIKLICTVGTPRVLSAIEQTALSLLEGHSEVSSIIKHRKSVYQKNIEKIKDDIEFLSEQRKKTYQQLQSGNNKIDINQFDNESQFIYAYEKLGDLQELYMRTKAAVLIKPFIKNTVARHSKTKGIAMMAIVFLALAFAVGVFREIKL